MSGSAPGLRRVRGVLARGRVSGSTRWRVVRLLWETSPGLAVALAAFALADGVLPNLAWVGLGASTGRIPAAVTDGLGSAAGRALLVSLAIGTGAYALSLMRTPAEDLLESLQFSGDGHRHATPPGPGRVHAARDRAPGGPRRARPAVLRQRRADQHPAR